MNNTEWKDRLRTLGRITKVEAGEQRDLLPEELWFGPLLYRVDVKADYLRDKRKNGMTYTDAQVIDLNPAQGEGRFRVTTLHEILHGLMELVGLDGGGEPLLITEEEMVKRLAPALLDFLRQNPGAVLYLMAHTD